MTENLTFEQLPKAVTILTNEISELKKLLLEKSDSKIESNNPLKIKEVAKLTSLTVSTLYGYVQRCEIPFHKKNNRLYFFKSEIIDWIKTGKQKTLKEIEVDVDELLSNKK